jgi:phosphatidylglycerol:prolipoprotein diacylglycerol transferase
MYPELFKIPIVHLTVPSYGLMLVIGFLAAVSLIRHLSRRLAPDPQLITTAALYSLIAGVVGARLFYVIHYFDSFRGDLLSVFAVWRGGLELLGGVLSAIAVIIIYLRHRKLPVRRYLDILAIGLLLALAIGRIGCFLNGCCFGKPSRLPWLRWVRFPYASLAYISQINPDLKRNRPEPYLQLPTDFLGWADKNGRLYPKPYEDLTAHQKDMVDNGPYRCLPVHPTQLYSSANAAFLCLILYLFWRRAQNTEKSKKTDRPFTKPGATFALMFILYGITRFLIEFLRDDNPFEYGWWAIYKGGTISQNISIYITILGLILILFYQRIKTQQPK